MRDPGDLELSHWVFFGVPKRARTLLLSAPMRCSSSIALVLCCACGASEPAPSPATVEQQPATEQPSEPPATPVPELPPAEPVTCADQWCRFSAFPPNGRIVDVEADGTQVWILVEQDVIARWDGGPGDLPERWTRWNLGADVLDLWVGDGVVVAVGREGFTARFEAGKWTTINTNAGIWRGLASVDGLPGGPVWIAADDALLRLDNTTVTEIELPSSFSAPGTPQVEVVAADEIWLMADLAVWRRKGGEWRKYPFKPPPPGFSERVDLDSTGPNDVWALERGNVHHWNGSRWKQHALPQPVSGPLDARSPNDVIVANGSQSYFRWDGSEWTKRLADGQLVFAEKALAILDKTTTRWADHGIGFRVRDVWLGEHTTWIVGGNETLAVARFDGRVWQRWTLDAERGVRISGLGDDPWVASRSGDVFRLVDGEWQREATGLTDKIRGIEVTGSGEAWVWSTNGLARRVDGRWTVVEIGGLLRSFDVAPDGTVMALSYQPGGERKPKTLRRFDGSRLEALGEVPLTCQKPESVLPLARDLAIATCGNMIARWNGAAWTEPTRIADRKQEIYDTALVGDKVLVISGRDLVELDTAELLPAPPIEASWLHGNSSGRLWVRSSDGDLAFHEP